MWRAGSCRPLTFCAVFPLLELLPSPGLLERTVGRAVGGLHRFRVGDVGVGVGETDRCCNCWIFRFGVDAVAREVVPWL